MSYESVPQDPSLADPLPPEPFALLRRWIDEAREVREQPNPAAMVVASVDAAGDPQARVVLCRGLDAEAGSLVFYTNRQSAKGRELTGRPRATALFHWDHSARQARITGAVHETSDAESDAYWATRPRLSQIAAAASRQSEPVASRRELLAFLDRCAESLGGHDGSRPVPRPGHWGGYRLVAERVELWVGARGRAHDRARWQRPGPDGAWHCERLQP